MIALLAIGFPFAIAGILIATVRRYDYPRFLASGLALSIAATLRIASGNWLFMLGEAGGGSVIVELVEGAVSWAIGSILMALTYSTTIRAFRPSPKFAKAIENPSAKV